MRQSDLGLEMDGPRTQLQCKHFFISTVKHQSNNREIETRTKQMGGGLNSNPFNKYLLSTNHVQVPDEVLAILRVSSTFGCSCRKP